MSLFKKLKLIHDAKNQHFLSVDKETYYKWKLLIRLVVILNNNYKSCEIFRKKYKNMKDFVVIGLKYNGKNVKRRTSGIAKGFLNENEGVNCIYCDIELDKENATADHIIPISKGGNNSQINIIVCCRDCNNERGNLDFKEFLILKKRPYKKVFI